MKDLIISCMHLGSPLFKSEKEIINLFSKPYRNIYLLGDIFDVWEMKWGQILANYQEIIKVMEEVSERKQVFFVRGNHDPPMFKVENIFPRFITSNSYTATFGDDIVMLRHGNDLDSFFVRIDAISKFLYYILVFPINNIAELNVRDALKNSLHDFTVSILGKSHNDLISGIEKRAVAKYKKVIIGHTHVPKIHKSNNSLYVNPGDWVYNRTYVEYDAVDNKFILRKGWGSNLSVGN